jgi:hypothetical protein
MNIREYICYLPETLGLIKIIGNVGNSKLIYFAEHYGTLEVGKRKKSSLNEL